MFQRCGLFSVEQAIVSTARNEVIILRTRPVVVWQDVNHREFAICHTRSVTSREEFVQSTPQIAGQVIGLTTHCTVSNRIQCCTACSGRKRIAIIGSRMFHLFPTSIAERDDVEQVCSPYQCSPGKPACQNLRECRHIWRNAVMSLRSSRMHAKTGNDFIENQQHAVPGAQFSQPRQEFPLNRDQSPVSPGPFDDAAGGTMFDERLLHQVKIVRGDGKDIILNAHRYPRHRPVGRVIRSISSQHE